MQTGYSFMYTIDNIFYTIKKDTNTFSSIDIFKLYILTSSIVSFENNIASLTRLLLFCFTKT